MNVFDILILLVVTGLVAGAVRMLRKQRAACRTGCGSCPLNTDCGAVCGKEVKNERDG